MQTAKLCIPALMMALINVEPQRRYSLIHHSDRGRQYLNRQYTEALKSEGIRISMTQTGDPREHAVAERVNGIFKQEHLPEKLNSLLHAADAVQTVVN